jgi:antitoxin HicB
MRYAIDMTPDDNGTLLVTCPAFPELTTFGDNEAEALRYAGQALEEAVAARISDGATLPEPQPQARTGVTLPTLAALKAALYRALRESGITKAELGRRLGWHSEQVDRLFRLDHASRLDQLEAAFHALGRAIDVRVKELA